MNFKFILFIAGRYLKTKRKTRKTASSFLSIIGITIGVMALLVVIGIMNGFQLSFIEPILNISSFHLQISGGEIPQEKQEAILKLRGIVTLLPFTEYQTVMDGRKSCLVRGFPADVLKRDPSFGESFKIRDPDGFNSYDLPEEELLNRRGTMLVGNHLAYMMGLNPGDSVHLLSLSGNPSTELRVGGIFKTGFSEIDETWAIISFETARQFEAESTFEDLKYGVKLTNRYNDLAIMEQIRNIIGEEFKVESWRHFNSKFFSALRTEKIMMALVIGLIFIVVGFNIFHSLKRSVMEKVDEIALLKALGTPTNMVKYIFIIEGFFIGLISVVVGTILGFLLTYNINEFFSLIEGLVNQGIFPLLEKLATPLIGSIRLPHLSIFSPQVFYMDRVPVRILLQEAVFIDSFAMLSCVVAAYFAAQRVANFKPAEILRYE